MIIKLILLFTIIYTVIFLFKNPNKKTINKGIIVSILPIISILTHNNIENLNDNASNLKKNN